MKSKFSAVLTALLVLASTTNARAADLVDTAVAAGSFKTLAAALGAADLVDTLKGPRSFTVFAPTDDAFAKLPPGLVDSLLKPENKAKLASILTYHVIPDAVKAEKVVTMSGAVTLNGQRIDIATGDGGVQVDAASVIQADIVCDNGVIHVIDSVILPSDKSLVETAQATDGFSTLVAAAQAAGLVDALTGPGPLTVLAPNDEAFASLPAGTFESLLQPENRQKLADILKFHVIPGRVYSDQALQAGSAKTLQGSAVQFFNGNGGATVNGAKLLALDLDASNGVIHVIDTVLIPPVKNAIVDPRSTIRHTIAKGSALFNSGHHAACATLYEETLTGLMDADVDHQLKGHMSHVLSSAGSCSCPTTRAWTLRHGLDQMYAQLAD
ncbi:MAG: fasciclin domain-containing protein [Planctomycetota bacterium]